jgi:hypothetical protein
MSELEQRIIQSYRWYGDAIQSGIAEEELLKYMISMENMLIPENKLHLNKRETLARRLADLRGIYQDYREAFKDTVVALYQRRNELVHGAELNVQGIEDDVDTAHRLASEMFALLLAEEVDEYDNTRDLIDDIEERAIPVRPDDEPPFRIG